MVRGKGTLLSCDSAGARNKIPEKCEGGERKGQPTARGTYVIKAQTEGE
jgi:hypothetical protein